MSGSPVPPRGQPASTSRAAPAPCITGAPQPVRVCPCCGRPARRIFRVKHTPTDQPGVGWRAACAICSVHLGEDNPHFVFGGLLRTRSPHLVRARPGHHPQSQIRRVA